MRKLFCFLTVFLCCTSLTACGGTDKNDSTATDISSSQTDQAEQTNTEQVNIENALVVYFSLPETTEADNMTEEEENSTVVINKEVLGNTQYAAMVIQENTGADLFRIEPQKPYTTNHEELVDIASQEQKENARPAIKDTIANFEQYDTVFIGYPIWWSDIPMIMYSFFDKYDFSGKTIIPFCTHGGSGLAGTLDTISELEPNATIYEQALSISRDDIAGAEAIIIEWIDTLNK